MTVKELIEMLNERTYNDDDNVVIEAGAYDFEIVEVYKDGKGDICLVKGGDEL
ncbi:hypothetical protein CPT_Stills4 [Bacillus phage Stills]|uniref:Uncharacterized protein n=1 Tax=Bacillus phage Stills TaxID=1610833 RepID=A0A0E3XAK7_9CAUD|nr:hypothetical protein CPT_Stills4 [Bacillus phage Stills]AKC02632.1 hypothetical protein CPT_Stills4 [Bacillus phage Stills]